MVRAIVHEGSPGRKVKLKPGRFKPGVKREGDKLRDKLTTVSKNWV